MNTHYILFTLLLFFIGCVNDAPHDNPRDPHSLNYQKKGALSGRIIIANQTIGISNALVTLQESQSSVLTDHDGFFLFTDLSEGSHRFLCSKENFDSDTFTVSIISDETAEVVRGLNGAPVVISQNILTRKIDYVSFSPQYFVDVSADVADPNSIADLDSVWFNVDSVQYPMEYSVSSKKFITTLPKSTFPTNTIQYLVGKSLHIVSRDRNGATNISTSFFVSRVIENTALPLYPKDFNTVKQDSVYFSWTPPDVTFKYTSTVMVYRTGTEEIVKTFSGLISFYEQYPTDFSVMHLDAGNYFWTVTIVDEFGNSARSKESYFVVE